MGFGVEGLGFRGEDLGLVDADVVGAFRVAPDGFVRLVQPVKNLRMQIHNALALRKT